MQNFKINKKNFTIILTLLALSSMLFGIYRGEVSVVLKKAINICMECIGIG